MAKKVGVIDKIIFFLATKLGWLFILFWGKLTRIEYVGREHHECLKQNRKPFIICTWHGRILLPIYLHRYENVQAMVSEHRDGEMIAQILQRLGYGTVRGSSTRGGKKAMLGMLKSLRAGGVGAIMPDGPTGPRHVFKPGAIFIAQRSNAFLLPLTFSSSRHHRFRSWDQFLVWLPFSKSVAFYAPPIEIPPTMNEAEFEAFRQKVESAMIAQEKQADEYFQK